MLNVAAGSRHWKSNVVLSGLNFANVLLPLAVIGWSRMRRRLGAATAAAIGAVTLIEMLFFVRYPVPDQFTFILPTLMVVGVAAALGLATLCELSRRWRTIAITACIVSLVWQPAFFPLVRELRSDQILLRQAAAEALVGSASASVNGALIVALKDSDDRVRASAALALGWEENVGAVPALIGSLSDSSWRVVDSAVSALGEIGLGATDTLLAALRSPESSLTVRYQVSRALSAPAL